MISQNYRMWRAELLDISTCSTCRDLHGKVYEIGKKSQPNPPIHPNCRCRIAEMPARYAGETTKMGKVGADYWLSKYGKLPDYYISKSVAKKKGWIPEQGNLSDVLPGVMIAGGVYSNSDGHLPETDGRIWYEADLDYSGRFRGSKRILFSNDGLIFVTFDHYETFVEIIQEGKDD